MTMWVTRSAPDNLATARRLRGMGYGSVVVPVLRTRRIDQERVEGRPDAIVFSSAHAVRHHQRPAVNDTIAVFAASEGVARAAQSAGYANVTSTGGDDDILAGLLAHILPCGGRVVEFCARRTAPTLRDALSGQGFRIEPVPVYDAVPVAPTELGDMAFFSGIGGIMVHSSAGARAVRRIVARAGWRGRIWCISPASAAHLAGLDGVKLSCAAEPTEQALLALVEQEALPTRWPAQATPGRLPLKPISIGSRHGRAANDGDDRDEDGDGSPPAA